MTQEAQLIMAEVRHSASCWKSEKTELEVPILPQVFSPALPNFHLHPEATRLLPSLPS